VAAARHILIICGSVEIDGHAFCSGIKLLDTALQESMIPVIFLIQGAIFRSRYISRKQNRLSLDICSLGELFDMYYAHEAINLHDKIYALLGMCSDDLSVAGLEPDYSIRWGVLMQRLIKFLLGDQASVNTWNDKKMEISISQIFPNQHPLLAIFYLFGTGNFLQRNYRAQKNMIF
jgi:hypothetical protein